MSTHRKKPVEITAYEFLGGETSGRDLAKWCGGRYRYEAKASDPSDVAEWIDIPTLEGVMRASRGDYIIRGVQGEFYPCKPGIFEATYEHVDGGGTAGDPLLGAARVAADDLRNAAVEPWEINACDTIRAFLATVPVHPDGTVY